ncbi:Cqd1p [Sporobolomyces koalae]|uniref:Cqd1p n=1 Tax=Sporobolomyces koalae TaxID=500713 RepID=UPI00317D22D6
MLAARLRLLPKPTASSRAAVRFSAATPRSRPFTASNARSYSSGPRQSHQSGFNYSSLRYALVPILIGVTGTSSLLLDSTPPEQSHPSIKTILDNVDKPDEEEFLISANARSEERKKRSILRRCFRVIREYLLEPISTSLRFLHLAFLFLPVLVTAPILALELIDDSKVVKGRRREKRTRERRTTRWWYRLLVHQMEWAGPTFIKLAQWAGSRTDLFPAELCLLFSKLHSQGVPHSFRHTKRVLQKAFGIPFEQIFAEFRQEPLGTGAIAQVYKAVLNPDLLPDDYLTVKHADEPGAGPVRKIRKTVAPLTDDSAPARVPSAEVAIKVLHPGVEKMIRRDLKIMMFFAKVLNALPGMEWLSFPEEVEVFGEMMMSQVDLRIEANNLAEFEQKFMHRPTVSFPRAMKKYTSQKALIEEFEDAVPLELFLKHGGGAFDHRIANLGLDAFLNMLLIDNFVHSDLHPGNIMIKFFKPTTRSILSSLYATLFDQPEPDAAAAPTNLNGVDIVHRLRSLKKDREGWLAELEKLDQEGYQPEIVFIDTGLVTRLNDLNRRNFLDLFTAVASFDGYRAGKLMVERCRAPELVRDEEGFALRMQHLVLSVKSQTFSLAKIRIADVLSQVLNNVREHHVKMEADFVNTVISILLLEGIGRQLDPEMDLFKSALPILRKLGKQVSTDQVMSQAGKIDVKDLGSMLKIWVWVEARQFASIAVSEVDDDIRYDNLMPSI